MQDLELVSPFPDSSVETVVSPTQCLGQKPFHGTEEMEWPSTAKRDAAQADALAAVQQITQPPSPSCATSESISLKEYNEASVAGAQGELSNATVIKRLVGSVKPVPRSASNSPQESRTTLPNQVHSLSPAWSYHSN